MVLADAAVSGANEAVHGYRVSGADAKQVPGAQGSAGQPLPEPIDACAYDIGQRLLRIAESERIAEPQAFLHEACKKQKKGEHDDGVEIHVSDAAQRCHGARRVGDPDGERHGKIHHERAPSQVAERAFKKTARGEKNHEARHQ